MDTNMDSVAIDSRKIREIMRQMGQFMADFEIAEMKMIEWKKSIEEHIFSHQQHMVTHLRQIEELIEEMSRYASDSGLAYIRTTAAQTLTQGQEHVRELERIGAEQIKVLQQNNEYILRIAKRSFDRLDKASNFVVKSIADALSALRSTDFKRLAEENRHAVAEVSHSTVDRVRYLMNRFHWKTFMLIIAMTMVVSLTVGLYLTDELPWEIHKRVATQRNAGQALINAWPSLTVAEKQQILRHAKKAFI